MDKNGCKLLWQLPATNYESANIIHCHLPVCRHGHGVVEMVMVIGHDR